MIREFTTALCVMAAMSSAVALLPAAGSYRGVSRYTIAPAGDNACGAAGQGQYGAQSRDAIDRMRDRDLQPERIMDVIGLRPGMTVGEAGASYGYFTFKVSRRVGPTGTVYANDIDGGALASIRERAESEKAANITTVLGEVADPRFPRNDLDMIVVFDCLFEFSEQAAWMKNARRYLKPVGRLVIVDPDVSKMASAHFLSRQQVAGFARDSGYRVLPVDDTFLKTHMIVVLEPTPPPNSTTPGESLKEQGDIPFFPSNEEKDKNSLQDRVGPGHFFGKSLSEDSQASIEKTRVTV